MASSVGEGITGASRFDCTWRRVALGGRARAAVADGRKDWGETGRGLCEREALKGTVADPGAYATVACPSEEQDVFRDGRSEKTLV